LARQSVQRIADLLVKDGLAVYTENPTHKRAKLLRLNARGLKALRVIEKAQRVWANNLGKEVSKRELEKVTKVLAQLLEILEDENS
jgi:DNA-binding MarR family transcriptional regulator